MFQRHSAFSIHCALIAEVAERLASNFVDPPQDDRLICFNWDTLVMCAGTGLKVFHHTIAKIRPRKKLQRLCLEIAINKIIVICTEKQFKTEGRVLYFAFNFISC